MAEPEPEALPWKAEEEVGEDLSEEDGEQITQEDIAAAGAGKAYELKVPDYIPLAERTEEREALVSQFAFLAPHIGVGSQQANEMLEAFADIATQVEYKTDTVDAFSPEDGVVEMEHAFGGEAYDLMCAAQRYVAGQPYLAGWLDKTGLGNDPGVLCVLALAEAGTFKLSASDAQQEINKLMQSQAYRSGDKLTIVKTQVLARIAGRDRSSPQQMLNELAGKKTYESRGLEAAVAASAGTSARAEIEKMLGDKHHPLNHSGHVDHDKAVGAYLALLKKLT